MSFLLRGSYVEHTIGQGGIHRAVDYTAGALRFRRSGKLAHRVELKYGDCWSLFFTGPVYREWGFHCPERGWVHWREFTGAGYGDPGRGCDP